MDRDEWAIWPLTRFAKASYISLYYWSTDRCRERASGSGTFEKAGGDAIDLRQEVGLRNAQSIWAESKDGAVVATMQMDQMVVVLIGSDVQQIPEIGKVGEEWAWVAMETAVEIVADGLEKQAQGSSSEQENGGPGQANDCGLHLSFLSHLVADIVFRLVLVVGSDNILPTKIVGKVE
ncbi:hypothetical protein XANCAGTX0491_007839 [Xanthoria calcicola]